ncbi:MAG: VgrG-related protein [Humibacillus sp.]|nr:VgrG-related protein [Humibacillus sp.]MDN5778864.1 VgrG-related protein [Humibacillus sp.]
MPAEGEETSDNPIVKVAGRPLTEDVDRRLTKVVVDSSRNVPDLFVLTFLDAAAAALDDGGFTIGAKVEISVQRSGPGGPQPLLTGEVTAIEVEGSVGGVYTTVRGYDQSHRLYRGRRVEAYVDVKAGDVARKVAARAGLGVGTIDAFEPVLKHVGQGGVSDWALLHQLASDAGAEVVVIDGALSFRKPTQASKAPSGSDARANPLVLEHGVNLVSFRASITAADQVGQVEVRGWDVQGMRAVVGRSHAHTASAQPTGVDPSVLAQGFKAPDWVESRPTLAQESACTSSATAIADRIAGSYAEIDGVTLGNPKLMAGAAVTLAGVGKPFDGHYVLTGSRHEFSDLGYLTRFTVSNASERSVYGLTTGASGGPASASARMPVSGVISAVVSDVKDPQALGRVRVTFPVMSDDYVSWWARTVQLGAGAGRGSLVLPEVGDEVLVAFGMGDFDEPYVLGGLYNGKLSPQVAWNQHIDGTSGAITRRAFVSRTGMIVEMIETPSEEKLTISTNDGKQRVTLVQKGAAAIEILSEGPVTVTAQKDVSVTAKTGNVTVEASSGNVTVASPTGTLSLKGMTVDIEAQTGLTVKGVNVTVSGSAMTQVSSSGITTVKGSLVNIN